MSHNHSLKILTEYFRAITSGVKTFEIRNNTGRDFKVGDRVKLNEYVGGVWNWNWVLVEITYITDFEQKPGYVVFGFRIVSRYCDEF